MGGAVAFEMARKLRQNGEEGAIQLIMIDPWTPPENEASPQAPVALALANLWIEFYKDLAGKAFEKPEELLAQLKQLSPEKQATLMLGQARKDHLLTDEKSLSRLFGVFSANANALARYNPGAYQGHAIVIQAEQRESGARQPASAWQSLFSQPLEVIDLPGNHYTLLTTPGVGRLANYLKERLLQ
jgi:thioesterase domain-containing protein